QGRGLLRGGRRRLLQPFDLQPPPRHGGQGQLVHDAATSRRGSRRGPDPSPRAPAPAAATAASAPSSPASSAATGSTRTAAALNSAVPAMGSVASMVSRLVFTC